VNSALQSCVEYLLNPIAEGPELSAVAVVDQVSKSLDLLSFTCHPLGFLHADVSSLVENLPPNSTVRLHAWTEESLRWRDSLGRIHDHYWYLTSVVLCGRLVNSNFVATSSPRGKYSLWISNYGGAERSLRKTNERFDLELLVEQEVSTGNWYDIPAHVPHETEVADLPTMTVVLSVPDLEDPNSCIYSPGETSIGTQEREAAPVVTVRRILDAVVGS